MSMILNKPLVWVLGVATIGLVLAACGGGDEGPQAPTATATPRPTPIATPRPAPTATPTRAAATATPAPPTATPTTAPAPTVEPTVDVVPLGRRLAGQNGCTACHTTDGSAGIGPTWKGLFGKEETLTDGATVLVDEAYLRESIVDPDVKLVKGFVAGLMPRTFGDSLTGEQIDAIIAYIRTLR